ncbi:MAG TPA: beta-propeller fold lactonase family protein [Tepidisphaeraceae bacterium]|nr:beta-propeller fold lactonase family protein [Tepidisphaeraceae bacterium]
MVADTLVFTGSRQSRTRLLCLDPTGNFLLIGNQGTNQMLLCRIDQSTGQLKPSGPLIDVPSPVCIIFVPPPDSKPQRE